MTEVTVNSSINIKVDNVTKETEVMVAVTAIEENAVMLLSHAYRNHTLENSHHATLSPSEINKGK